MSLLARCRIWGKEVSQIAKIEDGRTRTHQSQRNNLHDVTVLPLTLNAIRVLLKIFESRVEDRYVTRREMKIVGAEPHPARDNARCWGMQRRITL